MSFDDCIRVIGWMQQTSMWKKAFLNSTQPLFHYTLQHDYKYGVMESLNRTFEDVKPQMRLEACD